MSTETQRTVAAWLTAAATIALVVVAYRQLSSIDRQMRVQGDREKKWATVRACDQYGHDPVLHAATKNLWSASDGGTDYTRSGVDRHDILTILNYLESLAVGVHQGVYVEDIVRDHFRAVMSKAVTAFVDGKSEPGQWKAPAQFLSEKDAPALVMLVRRWNEQGSEPSFRENTEPR